MSIHERTAADLMDEADERDTRNASKCQCGYPDMPGQCPGPRNCPMVLPEDEE